VHPPSDIPAASADLGPAALYAPPTPGIMNDNVDFCPGTSQKIFNTIKTFHIRQIQRQAMDIRMLHQPFVCLSGKSQNLMSGIG
jgi:hypothetical protein